MVRFYRMLLGVAFAFSMTAAMAAPWNGGRGLDNSGVIPDVAFPKTPSVVWKAYVSTEVVDEVPTNVVSVGGVLVVGYGKKLFGLTTETGSVIWQQDLADIPVGDLIFLEGNVIVSCANGMIEARKPTDGTTAWTRKLSGGIRNNPALAKEGMLLYATRANTLDTLDPKDGKIAASTRLRARAEVPPVFFNDSLIICYSDGKFERYQDNVLVWRSPALRSTQVNTPPISTAKYLIVTSDKSIFALDPTINDATTVAWVYKCSNLIGRSVTVVDDKVYAVNKDGRLFGINLNTGEDVLTHEEDAKDKDGKDIKKSVPGFDISAEFAGEPIILGSQMLIRTKNGLMSLLNKDTLKTEWSIGLVTPEGAPQPKTPYMGLPAIDGEHVYFAGTDGILYHLSASGIDVEGPTAKDFYPKPNEQGFVPLNTQYLGGTVLDEGSGIKPNSITMKLDSTNYNADAVQYYAPTNLYFIELDSKKPLKEGMHRLVITATDYRGNTSSTGYSFFATDMVPPQRTPVSITGEFLPAIIQMPAGSLIIWTNNSGAARTVIADNLEFSSDAQFPNGIPSGESWWYIIPRGKRNGQKIKFHDRLTNIKGTIEVGAGMGDPGGYPPGYPPGGGPGYPPGYPPGGGPGYPPGLPPPDPFPPVRPK